MNKLKKALIGLRTKVKEEYLKYLENQRSNYTYYNSHEMNKIRGKISLLEINLNKLYTLQNEN
jgi:hypothetical protein